MQESKEVKEEKFTVEISRGLYDKLNKIRENYSKASSGVLRVSYFEASKILSILIDKAGGIKDRSKII